MGILYSPCIILFHDTKWSPETPWTHTDMDSFGMGTLPLCFVCLERKGEERFWLDRKHTYVPIHFHLDWLPKWKEKKMIYIPTKHT